MSGNVRKLAQNVRARINVLYARFQRWRTTDSFLYKLCLLTTSGGRRQRDLPPARRHSCLKQNTEAEL